MDIRRWFARSLGVCIVAAGLSACAANATVEAPVQTEGTGPPATALAIVAGDQATCVTERRTVETAIESYFALNGTDITALDDLIPDLMRESVSARWALSTDPSTGTPAITGIGTCTGA